MRVWGTASEALSFTSLERLEEQFSERVQQLWIELMDSYAVPGAMQLTWREMQKFILGLRVAPLKGDTLTVMQFASLLADLGFCQQPTTVEMIDWICDHPQRGAFRGLQHIFQVELKTRAHVHWAFMLLYTHLAKRLSRRQQREVSFGPIFLENLLCKVVHLVKVSMRQEVYPELNAWIAEDYFARHRSPNSLDIRHVDLAQLALDLSMAQ